MRYFLAVLACGVLFFLYSLLGAALGWKHGGGIIPMAVLLFLISITWRSITKKDKKQVDDTKAVKLFRKAAEQGDALAQFSLGNCYYFGNGVNKDYTEAVKWYRKAAEQGNGSGQYNLGNCYYNGQGVTQDYAEAVKWYRKAAEQGLADARYNLGMCYNKGRGVAQDYTEAVKWYRKAAEQGLVGAQVTLGFYYAAGQGVNKNLEEMVKWFRKAAEQGDAEAQYNLGECYYLAQGVAKDDAEAVKWFRLAAKQGHAIAREALKKINGENTSPGEFEKYLAKQEEEQNQDNSVEPPSSEVDKLGLRWLALVTHMLIVASIFIFCTDFGYNFLFLEFLPWVLIPVIAVSVFFLFWQAWYMLKQGWRLNYPVYLKRLPIIVPFTILLSFGLFVVAAATKDGMFRLGFLLVYWIPGGIFLVHFINSLEKKS